MAAHGTEREAQRLRDYVHTEMMLLAERCSRLEQQVAGLKSDLEAAARVADAALGVAMFVDPRPVDT